MSGNLTVPSLNGGQLAGFRNQLINADFRVYQRGEIDNISSGEFLADRWTVRLPSGTVNKGPNWNFDLNAYMMSYTLSSSVTGWTAHVQKIEAQNIRPFEDKEVTVSCYSNFLPYLFIEARNNNSATEVLLNFVAMTEIEDIGSGVKRYSHTFTPRVTGGRFNGSNPEGLGMQVAFSPASSSGATIAAGQYDLTLAQLEPGPVATPFEHRPIGTELALCQRYYFKSTSSTENVVLWATGSGNNGACVIKLPVEMRVSPSCSVGSFGSPYGASSPKGTVTSLRDIASVTKLEVPLRVSWSGGAPFQTAVDNFTADAEL
jgi:hypothetical protein